MQCQIIKTITIMRGDVKTREMVVTPERAKEFLANNPNNRKVTISRVKDYADQMLRGLETFFKKRLYFIILFNSLLYLLV